MEYALKSDNEDLKKFRERFPLDEDAVKVIQQMDSFLLQEIVFAHYEINPFMGEEVEVDELDWWKYIDVTVPLLENFTLEEFKDDVDEFSVFELFKRSFYPERIAEPMRRNGDYMKKYVSFSEIVKKKDYVGWAIKKGLPLPDCLCAEVTSWKPPELKNVAAVKNIPFEKLSFSVLESLGANAIAQILIRKAQKKHETAKISSVSRSNLLSKFVEECALAEGKPLKSNDTIRDYIEKQFS